MKIAIPPNSPCIRCGGPIVNSTGNRMVCQQCKQVWTIGPEGCWEGEFDAPPDKSPFRYDPVRKVWAARVETTITISKDELLKVLSGKGSNDEDNRTER
jgi:hypothetical protein